MTMAEKPKAEKKPKAGPSEEMKAKFRAALDAKKAHGGKDVSDGGESGAIHDSHGPAKGQQMFRRKSGG